MINAVEAQILSTKNHNDRIKRHKEQLLIFIESRINDAVQSGKFNCRIYHDNKFEPMAVEACRSILINLGYKLIPLDRGFIIRWLDTHDLYPD